MMGPNRFPVIHNRAFGHATMFPMTPQARPSLGAPPGRTGDGDRIDYDKAKAYYDGVRNCFDDLKALIGDAANTVLDQAKESYEEAMKNWMASKPTGIQL